ncbi:hypothetical protein BPUTSESOX_1090 [uncultured Gammaproteobacteria bacterium]|nr:hypothetical protein BPUTSESOX_1090 [uncultured Gammaproteobacteria bacterium]
MQPIAGGSINGRSLMDDYLQNKASVGSDFVISPTANNTLVFNRSATDVDNYDFYEKFSLTKTLTGICNGSDATANNSDTQSLNSSLNILKVSLKIEQFLPTQAVLLKYCLQKTVKKWRFAEVDYSSAKNDFGGFYNASSRPNSYAFATLQADGSIKAWGTQTMEAPHPNSN